MRMRMMVDDNVQMFIEENPQHDLAVTLNTNWQMYKSVPDSVSREILDVSIKKITKHCDGHIKIVME